ncbi:MAG: NAD(+) synthase [Gemmatimonadota bacterium]|jgi:NAD+ synthase (glutamine-hydrolysing)|nr:NAD(+) synthase [Gemmatimonadota bacterium]
MKNNFHSLYAHGFIRTAVCIPGVEVSNPAHNVRKTVALARRASEGGAVIALFPELGLSAYTNDDLFRQDALLRAVEEGLATLVEESRTLVPLLIVGAPLRFGSQLFNCAVLISRGRILGVVPKSYLVNHGEFSEARQFSAARAAAADAVILLGQSVPFGASLVFEAVNLPDLLIAVDIGDDLSALRSPATAGALAGATVLCTLAASNVTTGKAARRHLLCASRSTRSVSACLYTSAGSGESTTDLAWDGHALIYENGERIAESTRFSNEDQVVFGDLDLERIQFERATLSTFSDAIADARQEIAGVRRIPFEAVLPDQPVTLNREVQRFPYLPSGQDNPDDFCREVYEIQTQGLVRRLRASGLEKVVIGVSGGLDSALALIVAARAMDQLGLPRTNILGYSMPGFATSSHTRGSATRLMAALGVTAEEIDIRPSAQRMLEDIGHPAGEGQPVYDTTFENVQAGERTSHLFRLANHHNALVVGTGDLSELALGWTTYGVGDHMSHYNVNVSVPKTLIQYLVRWIAEQNKPGPEAGEVLLSILETEISPELVPGEDGHGQEQGEGKKNGRKAGKGIQSTEQVIGPYGLQDFNLYYITRFGFRPSKVAFLALHAWGDTAKGEWPARFCADTGSGSRSGDHSGPRSEDCREYDLATIRHWLEVFLRRFFQTGQFKRSALPNGPKVGVGSLSPRTDWRAPSDSVAAAWLEELRSNTPES